MQNVHFTPPQLATLFDVNVSTIKRWVDRGLLKAKITTGGHRRIDQGQIIAFLNHYPRLVDKSYVLARLVKQGPATDEWRDYYEALRRRRDQAAETIIKSAFLRTRKLVDVLDRYIAPTLREIGTSWSAGRITVYDEHRMSFLIRIHLLTLRSFVADPRPTRPLALLACAPNDYHELPLQMLDLVFRQAGWRTEILGTNTPPEEMIFAANRLKPRLLAVTKAYTQPSGGQTLRRLWTYAKKRNIQLVYGGAGWGRQTLSGPRQFTSLTEFSKHLSKPRRHA